MKVWKKRHWAAIAFVAAQLCVAAGCGGCDETTGQGTYTGTQTDAGDTSASCEDGDGDGFATGGACDDEQLDCDDADGSISPGAEEVCGDGIDNNCDARVDEDCDNCTDGQTRECGSEVGICEKGSQTCNAGIWSECEGGVQAVREVCDGADNDCDGEVDEDPEASLCSDGINCNGLELCEAGTCVDSEPIDCTHLDDPCFTGACQEKDGSCSQIMVADGTACDDGNFCTVQGVCAQGVCETAPRDCSAAGDQCNTGVCDEDADACVPQPISDGTSCDDGNFCTVGESCQAGMCTGAPRDCSAAGDQCNDGVCDEDADTCVPQPIADGTMCNDGQYCTVADTCQQGHCTSGAPRQCGAAGGSCRTGVCDEDTDSCTGDPVADGTSCEDGQFCTVGDVCQAGTCAAGGAMDCSSAGDQCNVGICDEANRSCVPSPKADGTTCDDSAFCTTADVCTSGSCAGSPRDCSGAGDQCNSGTCDEQADVCVPQPLSDGTSCDDATFCTVGDTCSSGTCGGSTRACAWAGDQCNDGVCDEDAASCVAEPVTDGTSCNDGEFCTESDTCSSGTCGGLARDCSAAGDQCNTGVCDETADTCAAEPVADGTLCDDGLYCTNADACSSGTCGGASRDCSAAGDACNDGVCDEQVDACVSSPKPDGTACDDGQYCTDSDACSAGSCTGQALDCSAYDNQCGVGMCDESQDMCYADATAADGASCTDGDACTANDSCASGVCTGSPSTPVADAGPDQLGVIPNTTVQLDGSGSTDPDGQALTYSWSFATRPSGSSASFSDPGAESPTFLADVSGTYEACLTVTDTDGCTPTTDCMTVTVASDKDLHIELVWFSDDSDVDIHFRAPEGTWWSRCGNGAMGGNCSDCFWNVQNPDWGLNGRFEADGVAANDPTLDVDNTSGYGPENINQDQLFDNVPGEPFRVGVHYYADRGAGDISARVRIYELGVLVFEDTKTLSCDDFWDVADIDVSGSGTAVSISPVGGNPQPDGRGQCP